MPAHREGRRAVNASFQSGKPGSVLSTPRAFGSIGTTEGLRYIRECRAKAASPQSLCRLGVEVALDPHLGHFRFEWPRSEEHTSELQSLMRISYAVFCLKKKKIKNKT